MAERTEVIQPLDPRLGRHIRHDERSRSFAAPRGAIPTRSVRHTRYGRRLNQGDLGACTGFAAAHLMNTTPFRAMVRPRPTFIDRDAVGIYSLATTVDDWDGAYPPQDTGSSGLAAQKALVALGWTSAYEWAFGFQHGLETIVAAPWSQGTWWEWNMMVPDRDGRCRLGGGDAGGHQYAWLGVEIRSKLNLGQNRSWFMNSWDTTSRPWGVGGMFWLTWADHEQLLAREGDLSRPKVAA